MSTLFLKRRFKLLYRILSAVFGKSGIVVFKSALSARVIYGSGGDRDFGIISRRVVTDEGVNMLCDAFQGLFTLDNFKYHISGTDTAVEAVSDTETDITGSTPSPVLGSQTEGASANIYETVATINYTSTLAITSHGLIDSATKSGSKLWDRSVFTAINVSNGDSIEFTYRLTISSGG